MPGQLEREIDVTVVRRCVVADDVVALDLAPVGDEPVPPWEPGAHIDLVTATGLVRQYSLCGEPADPRALRIAVQRAPDGRGGSRWVHESLRVGHTVRIRGPRNRFPLAPSARYLFLAGGIGITPLLPMIAEAAAAGADWRLHYGGRRISTMAFAGELQAAYPGRVRVWPQDECGLLDLDELLAPPCPETLVYCCGPNGLIDAVARRIAGWPDGALRVERFTPVATEPPERGRAFTVELAASGRRLTVPPDRSILAVLDEAGVQVLSSCQEGTCGTCETAVLAGEVDHRDSVLTDDERAAGATLLVCVSRALSDTLVLDL